jgi:hypothetical protein
MVSGRLADKDNGVWKVSRQGQGCLEGLQTRTRVFGRLADEDKGVWKVSKRGQGCL